MHLHTYFITLAEDADDAKSTVDSWIGEQFEKSFFDYGCLEESEDKIVFPVSEVLEQLEKSRNCTEKEILPEVEKDIEKYKADGNRIMLGYSHVRYGNILQENFCADMPYFNIYNWDWAIPTGVPEDENGNNWYAVRVDLHY
jgi:hypothetical protein